MYVHGRLLIKNPRVSLCKRANVCSWNYLLSLLANSLARPPHFINRRACETSKPELQNWTAKMKVLAVLLVVGLLSATAAAFWSPISSPTRLEKNACWTGRDCHGARIAFGVVPGAPGAPPPGIGACCSNGGNSFAIDETTSLRCVNW